MSGSHYNSHCSVNRDKLGDWSKQRQRCTKCEPSTNRGWNRDFVTFTSRGLKKKERGREIFFFFFLSPRDVMVVSLSFPLLFSKLTSLVVFSKTASSFLPLLCFPRPLRSLLPLLRFPRRLQARLSYFPWGVFQGCFKLTFPCCVFQDCWKLPFGVYRESFTLTASAVFRICFTLVCFVDS